MHTFVTVRARSIGATLMCGLGLLLPPGCGDDGPSGASGESSGAATTAGTGPGSGTADATGTDATASAGSEGGVDSTGDDTSGDTTGGPVDVDCDGVTIESPLASLPELAAVTGIVRGRGVELRFEPVDDALDYRVYVLPSADAVDDANGLHVQDAIYRCAGDRPAIDLPYYQNGYLGVEVQSTGELAGYTRVDDDAILGHVYTLDGPDRVPVYRLGSPAADHDGQCYGGRTANTRALRYIADADEREVLLDQGWRDDGVAFWTASNAARQVHAATDGDPWMYWSSEAELAARGAGEPVFEVLDAPAEGTVPLHRFWMAPCGGIAHDVLSAGASRLRRDSLEGQQPVWRLDWPDLQPDQVLVVEALDAGCPFQGHLAADAVAPTGNAQAFVTIDDVRAASPTGEVFVNGQHDPASSPQPIARSYVCPQIGAPESFDVLETFDAPLGLAEVDLNTYGGWDLYLENERLTATFYSLEPEAWSVDSVMGELWVSYADWASDTNGKFRLTPKTTGQVGTDSFVHATVEVDLFSTGRRYPQLWVSSAPAPVQDNMADAVTINLQTFGSWPTGLEIQRCDHRYWDVNDQCPLFTTQHEDFSDAPWPAQPFVSDLTGSGVRTRLDLWVSSDRAYAFIDGQPHGCVEYDGLLPAGEVTVTYGDTLYHSGVDEPVVGTDYLDFLREYQLTETRRHVDNFGFSSGLSAPAWDHTRLPCATSLP